jgi:hypothetical protein
LVLRERTMSVSWLLVVYLPELVVGDQGGRLRILSVLRASCWTMTTECLWERLESSEAMRAFWMSLLSSVADRR